MVMAMDADRRKLRAVMVEDVLSGAHEVKYVVTDNGYLVVQGVLAPSQVWLPGRFLPRPGPPSRPSPFAQGGGFCSPLAFAGLMRVVLKELIVQSNHGGGPEAPGWLDHSKATA